MLTINLYPNRFIFWMGIYYENQNKHKISKYLRIKKIYEKTIIPPFNGVLISELCF